ncbi:MAG: uracil-DNA glycosylase [Planctomycetes bacterium]|nr:uracil-DNA glycosylase [Planctomycetota bacterium]
MGLRTAPRWRDARAAQSGTPPAVAASRPPTEAPARISAPVAVVAVAAPIVARPVHSSERGAALAELRKRHDAECPHCTTAKGHTQTVFGEGSPTARLMFIGEAPGEQEDRTGRPFVGRAGEKLDEMISAMGLSREQVYIANVLKSRPPDNRTPLQHEIDGCGPFLMEQIRIIRPEVIVTLGGPATKLLLATEEGITRLRGVWAAWSVPGSGTDPIPVMPTYHPAYLLRNYTPKTRGEVWADLKAVMGRLGLPGGT